jgi:hypothetical protein
MTNNNSNLAKYRPVLTATQITHLISLCRQDLSVESIRCISILAPFEYKIINGVVSPAYISEPALQLANKLGFETEPKKQSMSLEQAKIMYRDYKANIGSITIDEIKECLGVLYVNDALSAKEESDYENSIIQKPESA